MRVMVTGAAGRIGSLAVRRLLVDGHDVVEFDVIAKTPGAIAADLTNADALATAMSRCDAVVHLAAIPKHVDGLETETCRVNILGTVTLLDQAVKAGVPRVVMASSICAAGLITSVGAARPRSLPVDEEFDGGADDLYGLSKRFGEQVCEAFERRYGIRTVSLRFASVNFPDDPDFDSFMTEVYSPAADGDALLADIRWQYVDVRDAVKAIHLAVTHPDAHGVYNVGASDTPGSDWRIWARQVGLAKAAWPAFLEPEAPLWSIDRMSAIGYEPAHSWREYPAVVQGVEGVRSRS